MLIDFNREQWELIHATLVYDMDNNGDMYTSVDQRDLMEIISRIENRVINGQETV